MSLHPRGSRELDVCGIGDSLVDLVIDATEGDLRRLGIHRGSTSPMGPDTLRRVRSWIVGRRPFASSGGSGANGIRTVASLGGRAAFMTRLGDDDWGRLLESELRRLGVLIDEPMIPGGQTGLCVSFVLSDSERTMLTDLGVCRGICREDVRADWIGSARWLLLEGYLLARPELGVPAALAAIEAARLGGTLVAVGLSALFVIERHRPILDRVVGEADLVFANEEEAEAFTGASGAEAAASRLATPRRGAVITAGARGAFASLGGKTLHCPPAPLESARDTTGAGDSFAGAFLYGIARGLDPARAARGAAAVAARVVSEVGAGPPREARRWWEEATRWP